MSSMVSNADMVRRGYKAFNEADIATLNEIFDQAASWHTPGATSIAGDRHGRDAVFAQFGRYGGETNGTFKAALQDVLATDDGRVVGIHRNTGERNGKRLDVSCCIVFEVKNGKIISGREHFYDLYNWDQFWG
ncbi:MAG: nuclear transport factor 2 family protein [Hyphomonadaceae bacterium]